MEPSPAYSAATASFWEKAHPLLRAATGADRDASAPPRWQDPAYAVEVVPCIKLDGRGGAEGPAVGWVRTSI